LLANESQTVKNTVSKPMNYNKGIPFPSLFRAVQNQVLEKEDQPLQEGMSISITPVWNFDCECHYHGESTAAVTLSNLAVQQSRQQSFAGF
jgi:hypothetical protein